MLTRAVRGIPEYHGWCFLWEWDGEHENAIQEFTQRALTQRVRAPKLHKGTLRGVSHAIERLMESGVLGKVAWVVRVALGSRLGTRRARALASTSRAGGSTAAAVVP